MALHNVSTIPQTEPPVRPAWLAMSHPPVLNMRGEQIGLGPLSADLLAVYQRWLNDFDLLVMLDRRFRPLTNDWIRTWFERQSRGNGDTLVFTIWDLATMTPIGNTALQDVDVRTRTAEFGIFIAEPQFRGDGRGTETTRMMVRFALETLALENVMLRVFDDNEPAIRTYEKVGFKEIGRRRGAHRRNGIPGDIVLMDITPADLRPVMTAAD
ncbi:MAG TPA: GNAT family protein [Thermomicrobiales bacterium]|nr:GNAT family protein [Thermomicrobiales bacterium]